MCVMLMYYSGNNNKHRNLFLFLEINMYETKNQYLSLINSLIYELLKQLRILIETEKITI